MANYAHNTIGQKSSKGIKHASQLLYQKNCFISLQYTDSWFYLHRIEVSIAEKNISLLNYDVNES